ncbi:LuxR C-terminal-related transcriptional regulator [Leucobacter sp. HY1910]
MLESATTLPGLVLLTGPSGIGKSHMLTGLAERFTERKSAHTRINLSAPDAIEQLTAVPHDCTVLIDEFESADYAVLVSVLERVAAGESCVAAIRNDLAAPTYHAALHKLHSNHPHLSAVLAEARNATLPPMSASESTHLIELQRPTPFDSAITSVIADLGWGRPGWILDLLVLAEAGKLAAAPVAKVTTLDIGDAHLPTLTAVTHAAEHGLTKDAIAAAIVLASIDPRTPTGAVDLTSADAVAQLLDARILLESASTAGVYTVPEFYAAELRRHAEAALVADAMRDAAAQLLMQTEFGISLSDRESFFCAWAFTSSGAAGGHSLDARADRAHNRVLRSSLATFLSFARLEARDLLLRITDAEPLTPLERTRAAAVLSGPLESVRSLQQLPLDFAPAGGARYGAEFLNQLLRAEVRLPPEPTKLLGANTIANTSTPDFDTNGTSALLFRRWNDNSELGDDTAAICDLARHHPVAEVALHAEQLVALEYALLGCSPPPILPTQKADRRIDRIDRIDRIAALAITSPHALQDVLASAALTEGVLTLITGANVDASGVLSQIPAHLTGAQFHTVWLRHLLQAASALTAGDAARASREWTRLEARAPRFIPLRLRNVITEIGCQLRSLDGVQPRPSNAVAHLLAYYFPAQFEGAHSTKAHACTLAAHAPGAPLRAGSWASTPPPSPLPLFTLIDAQSEAFESQNPSALLAAADRSQQLGHWGPATHAAQEANAIYVRRRATGNVAACHLKLKEIEAAAQVRLPWFTVADIAEPLQPTLTSRELETAQHAAAGLSNGEIASLMSCTSRTVESHLSTARAKLGAVKRAELGQRLRDFGYGANRHRRSDAAVYPAAS